MEASERSLTPRALNQEEITLIKKYKVFEAYQRFVDDMLEPFRNSIVPPADERPRVLARTSDAIGKGIYEQPGFFSVQAIDDCATWKNRKRNLAAKISQLPLQCPLESREDPDGRYWTREDITNPYDHLARGMPYSADTFLRLDILEKLKGQSEVAVLSVFIRVAIVKSGDDWRPWSAAKDKIARDPSPLAS
ncbi:hypothetical protein JCM3766R1_004717 [Sporobolomyces carnicolor]